MRNIFRAATAIALAVGAMVSSANAATVSIGLNVDGGGIVQVAGPTANSASISGFVAGPFVVDASGTAPPLLPVPGVLNTNNLSISTAAAGVHTLDVYITAQGLTYAAAASYFSSFTLNSVLGTVATTMSTFLDVGNGTFGGVLLSTAGPFSVATLASGNSALINCGGLCSVTALYHIVTTGAASSNATINVSVPGPIVGAGIPGLVIACASLLFLARRRRQVAAI